jgi:hypothetical protein
VWVDKDEDNDLVLLLKELFGCCIMSPVEHIESRAIALKTMTSLVMSLRRVEMIILFHPRSRKIPWKIHLLACESEVNVILDKVSIVYVELVEWRSGRSSCLLHAVN